MECQNPLLLNNQSVTINNLNGHFGISTVNNVQTINSIIVNRVYAKTIYAECSITAPAFISSGGSSPQDVALADGSVSAPSLSFINSPNTGIYKSANAISFTNQGINVLNLGSSAVFNAPITSSAGNDLKLSGSSGIIDFGGSKLTNFSGIAANPNRYILIAPANVITTNNIATLLYPIPTIINTAYCLTTDVICADTDCCDFGSFNIVINAKNIAGVITLTPVVTGRSIIENSLNGISADYVVNSNIIDIMVTGLVGRTLKWFGSTVVISVMY
jgi:hypothetical protein